MMSTGGISTAGISRGRRSEEWTCYICVHHSLRCLLPNLGESIFQVGASFQIVVDDSTLLNDRNLFYELLFQSE